MSKTTSWITTIFGICLGVLAYEFCESLNPKLASFIAKVCIFACLWWIGTELWFKRK